MLKEAVQEMGLKMAAGVSRTVAFYSLAFKIEPYKKKKPAPAVIVFPIRPLEDIFKHADVCEVDKHGLLEIHQTCGDFRFQRLKKKN